MFHERFRPKNLRLKAKKCRFGLKRIEYVGRVIDKDSLSMSKEQLPTSKRSNIPTRFPLLRPVLTVSDFGEVRIGFRFLKSNSDFLDFQRGDCRKFRLLSNNLLCALEVERVRIGFQTPKSDSNFPEI